MKALVGWVRLDEEFGYHYLPSPLVLPMGEAERLRLGFGMRWVSDRWDSYPPRATRDAEPGDYGGLCACIGWPRCCRYATSLAEEQRWRNFMGKESA